MTTTAPGTGISAARLEVVAELATLINTTFDLDEIFQIGRASCRERV